MPSLRVGIDAPSSPLFPHAGVDVKHGLSQDDVDAYVAANQLLGPEIQRALPQGLQWVCEQRDED